MGKIAHVVLWKLRQQASEEALQSVKTKINELKNLPGPISVHLGPPAISDRAQGYNYGLYSIFASREALDAYAVSEGHVKIVVENVRPNTEGVLAYDFELDE
ncbi:hypothetical protein Q5752_003600 [Cryptotrichosporon argae]